jgi:N-acetylmuramic acid 6-phosphate etherase
MTDTREAHRKAQEFLQIAPQFRLGELPTESSHPRTRQLSQLAQNNLPEAVELLRSIELEALKAFDSTLPRLEELKRAVHETFASGGRVYLCGCGATGRLSLTLETLWRTHVGEPLQEERRLFYGRRRLRSRSFD